MVALGFLANMSIFIKNASFSLKLVFHVFFMLCSCFFHVCFMCFHVCFRFCLSPRGGCVLRKCQFSSGKRVFSVERRMQDRSFFIILFRCVFMFVFIIVSCSLMCFGRFLGGMLELFGCFFHAWKCKFLRNMSGFGAQSPSISFARFFMYLFSLLCMFFIACSSFYIIGQWMACEQWMACLQWMTCAE